MANPAPTINQINAFNATQGTTIDFNIIGGTELVRSNRIYIYDLSDNSLICTHLYVSTESIHELPPNTDGSIVYESGKSSADFVNGAQYYAQIQTFTDIAGTEGGSGLSVAKMFWCLVDPTLTIDTIPSTISTTSYNVSATYNANTSVVSNIIQQYQFSLYSATGSLLQSSGVVVGSGTQQGTSTTYDISYNFTGLSVGSSYYVVVDVTTTQGMSVSVQSNTFTVSIDTPTLGEATVVNNACDGYISVTSNLSGEYGGSGSGEIVSFETDSENVFAKLQVDLDPIQDLNGYDAPWVGGAGKNLLSNNVTNQTVNDIIVTVSNDGVITCNGTASAQVAIVIGTFYGKQGVHYKINGMPSGSSSSTYFLNLAPSPTTGGSDANYYAETEITPVSDLTITARLYIRSGQTVSNLVFKPMIRLSSVTDNTYAPYENICPIIGHDEVGVVRTGKNLLDPSKASALAQIVWFYEPNGFLFKANTSYTLSVRSVAEVESLSIYATDKTTRLAYVTGGNRDRLVFTPTQDTYGLPRLYKDGGVSQTTVDGTMLELGTTATEYEPYTEESFHQDIEATYTPTVQENEPYLSKQTGDVGGDRETIELVGGTVAWNQLVARDGVNTTLRGITFTHNQNGTMRVSGTATEKTYDYFAVSASRQIYGNFVDHIILVDVYGDNYPTGVSIETGLYNGNTYVNQINISNNVRARLYKVPANVNKIVTAGVVVNASLVGTAIDFTIGANTYDLTQMFGSTIADYIYSLEQANAGAGVAWFRKLFPKPYYAYNAGELISVKTSAHKTVGFNQWDEEWENGYLGNSGAFIADANSVCSKNYIPIKQSATYYAVVPSGKSLRICAYKADKTFISLQSIANNTFTLPSGTAYIKWSCYGYGTTYNNDICINISDASKNGTYEPYVENTYPLDADLELRGMLKLDISNKLYYDGDTYKHDGSVNRKYGIVNLGALDWQSATITYNSTPIDVFRTDIGAPPNMKTHGRCFSTIYTNIDGAYSQQIAYVANNDKSAWVGASYWSSTSLRLVVRNDAYNDAATFKTAMSGVYLLYELDTPTTETADPFEEIQKVTPIYGTEEFVDSRTVPMPVYAKTQYLTRDVYGGYIDLVSGLLTVTHGIVDLGDYGWNYDSTNNRFVSASAVSGIKVVDNDTAINGLCSMFSLCSANQTQSANYNGHLGVATNGRIVARNTAYTDGTVFKTSVTGQKLVYELATPQTYQLTPQQIQTLVGQNNVWSEDGEIELSYHIPITNLLVKRQDVADVSGDWLTLYSQPITQASDMDFTFIDFTNQYGKTYKYALVPLLTQTQSGVEVEVEGGYTVSDEVQSVFDGVFIVDSTGSQKCKANVGYGNVDMNQAVGTITPIGAKYPVVITNSKNQYHNGSIYGTIVPDDYYFNGNLSRIDMVNKRDELEQFLTNKRAKIIKDWNGKIWLVMIMDNVSCTFNNNYGMGIVNFNTNWVEVGDPTNQQDLQATGLINVGGV